jgi:hypothetical protein
LHEFNLLREAGLPVTTMPFTRGVQSVGFALYADETRILRQNTFTGKRSVLSHRQMEIQPETANGISRPRFSLYWPWLVVLAAVLFAGFIRVRLLSIPLTRDEGEYAYAGQLILHGVPPYKLAYNMKLPGTYFADALGMAVFGQTIAGVHLTLLLANSLTVVFVFLLGRKLFGNLAGVIACVSYAIMALSPAVGGLATDANHFVVLFAVPGILLLLKANETGGLKTYCGSGLLLGLAFLMKQQGICFGLFGFVFLIWSAARNREIFSGRFAGRMLAFASGLVLPYGLTCLSLAAAGVFDRFWFWTVVYARTYEGEMPVKIGIRDYLFDHLQQTRDLSIGFWTLTLAGLLAAAGQRTYRRPMLFAVTLWLFSFTGTAAGFFFRGHYFILVLPAFALLVGMSVAALQSSWRPPWLRDVFKSLPVIAFGLVLSWMIFYQAQTFFQSPAMPVRRDTAFIPNPFVEAIAAAKLVRENSTADARIAVIGSEPEIYFYAQRRSATGYIYTYALMELQPHALDMQHDMAREIETNRPEFLVQVPFYLSWLPKPGSPHFLFDWFEKYARENYERIGLVGFDSGGKLVSSWGVSSNPPPASLSDHIIIFRRKTGLTGTTAP